MRTVTGIFIGLVVLMVLSSCISEKTVIPTVISTDDQSIEATATMLGDDVTDQFLADVISVKVTGESGTYQFSVGISSPDEGCEQYADWWEVVTQDGELIYRRVLLHSHVNEQPFVRSGSPVEISADTVVWVRAHMHPTGYGGQAMKGSVAQGFEQVKLSSDFAPHLADTPPLPEGCNF